ncbi:choline dehydrogenase [Deinobacterium chartae]|uniref:Choline dehydrogenase n=1 Tax=Deinobacterium chartae TaxID=521158 RepID=A0A841I0T2_9DEIO|nr:GMC family oxidoreductase N-terminal domain-containing protein [Deinobacterium chartae]MBB6097585.1 choline dehydrogenase [Deinobacterium chartae]
MEHYDYVVVGAGSAGCVLTRQLVDAGLRVLLLEAGGPDRSPWHRVPAAFPRLFKSEADWALHTEPQAQLNGRRLYWPLGRVLGGSSSINAMIYTRGNRADYDAWGPGWTYRDVLPYFRALEDFEGGASSYRGAGGPLRVEHRRYTNELSYAFVAAGAELGFGANPDFNAETQDGFGLYQVTCRGGERESAASAFLRPVMKRPNLRVVTGAQVRRVLLRGGHATGVEYLTGGRSRGSRVVRALHGVVLCAGAVHSPHLLMHSGIGPAGALGAAGLEVLHDLPGVGRNLQDHPVAPVIYRSTHPVSLDGAETTANLALYMRDHRGPFASNIAEAGGFVRSRPELMAPDLQYHFGPAYFLNHGFDRRPGHFFSIGATLVAPVSRGWVGPRSADFRDPPWIQPNYLEEEADRAALLRGLELARELAGAHAFDRYRGEEVIPGPLGLEAGMRRHTQTLYHPAGTCALGDGEDAVVDRRLKVRGLEGLYVADASVMPTVVRGNTNAAALMIGARMAAFLLDQELEPARQEDLVKTAAG